MSPRRWTDRSRMSGDGAPGQRGAPARITASAPTTGNTAADPGNRVSSVYANAASAIAASPSYDSMLRETNASRPAGASANTPPRPNSHALVGVAKYAATGSAVVWSSDQPKLAAVSAPI